MIFQEGLGMRFLLSVMFQEDLIGLKSFGWGQSFCWNDHGPWIPFERARGNIDLYMHFNFSVITYDLCFHKDRGDVLRALTEPITWQADISITEISMMSRCWQIYVLWLLCIFADYYQYLCLFHILCMMDNGCSHYNSIISIIKILSSAMVKNADFSSSISYTLLQSGCPCAHHKILVWRSYYHTILGYLPLRKLVPSLYCLPNFFPLLDGKTYRSKNVMWQIY